MLVQLADSTLEFRMRSRRFLARNRFWPEIFRKFPVPGLETGSHMTAHTTIQSYETANPGVDSR